jgi:hypothetical protein
MRPAAERDEADRRSVARTELVACPRDVRQVASALSTNPGQNFDQFAVSVMKAKPRPTGTS